MRILVCGGRDYKDEIKVSSTLAEIISSKGYCDTLYNGVIVVKGVTIIQGGAKGADHLAKEFAKFYHIPCVEFPADWETHRKSAGPIRNQQMLDEGKPDLVVAFPGGNGTADMVSRAKKAGIEIIEIKENNGKS